MLQVWGIYEMVFREDEPDGRFSGFSFRDINTV